MGDLVQSSAEEKPAPGVESRAKFCLGSVRVVIPCHELWSVTRNCLRTLALHASERIERVVVVDNGSGEKTKGDMRRLLVDGIADYGKDKPIADLAKSGRLTLLRNEANLDFGSACNAAANLGEKTEPYVLFLNNDTFCDSDFLSPLAELLDEKPEAAAVGALLLFPGTVHVQHAGVAFVERDGQIIPEHAYFGFDEATAEVGIEREWPAVTGACMLVRRSDFEAAGGFCDSLDPGKPVFETGFPFEDVDLCVKFRRSGRQVWMRPRSRLYHHNSATIAAFLSAAGATKTQVFMEGVKYRQLPHRRAAWRDVIADADGKLRPEFSLEKIAEKRGKTWIDSSVLIAIPVSDAYYWCLDQFLLSLEMIDYPKDQMVAVFLTNNCGELLQRKLVSWAYEMGRKKLFKDVLVPKSPIPGPPGHQVIVAARNEAAKLAISNPIDVLVFLDCDVLVKPLAIRNLVRAVAKDGFDAASGVYCYAGDDGKPLIFRFRDGVNAVDYLAKLYTDQADGREIPLAVADPENGLALVGPYRLAWEALSEPSPAEVDGLPFGFTALGRRAFEIPLVAGQKTSGTEDLSWCVAARARGLKLACLTREHAIHLKPGAAYFPKPPPDGWSPTA